MVLQARFTDKDERFFDINRDFAHCFDQVAMEVASRLEDQRWQPLNDYLNENGITQDQLGEACRAFCDFVMKSTEDRSETMADVLKRVGWFDVPEPAQVALMAYTGQVLAGMFFKGRRDATLLDEPKMLTSEELRWAGRYSAKIISMPPWRRALYFFFRRPLRWLRKKRNKRRR